MTCRMFISFRSRFKRKSKKMLAKESQLRSELAEATNQASGGVRKKSECRAVSVSRHPPIRSTATIPNPWWI